MQGKLCRSMPFPAIDLTILSLVCKNWELEYGELIPLARLGKMLFLPLFVFGSLGGKLSPTLQSCLASLKAISLPPSLFVREFECQIRNLFAIHSKSVMCPQISVLHRMEPPYNECNGIYLHFGCWTDCNFGGPRNFSCFVVGRNSNRKKWNGMELFLLNSPRLLNSCERPSIGSDAYVRLSWLRYYTIIVSVRIYIM